MGPALVQGQPGDASAGSSAIQTHSEATTVPDPAASPPVSALGGLSFVNLLARKAHADSPT
jgi:hypothetical protein